MHPRVSLSPMLSRFCCGAVLVTALGCSSTDFKVSGGDSGTTATDSETTTDSLEDSVVVHDDSPPDAPPPGPCDPEPGQTKYCFTVTAAAHPDYDTTASTELGIDGKGKLFVVLFDKDPFIAGAKAIKTITYPSDTMDMAHTDFPVKLQGVLDTPGPYSVMAYFADSEKIRGEGRLLAGDLAVPVKFTGKVPAYPTFAFTNGMVESAPIELKPLRRAKVIINAKAALKDFSTTVHGDGPVILGVTDATTITDASTWLHYAQRGCVDLQIQSGVPTPQIAYFPIFGDGSRNIFVGVVDYSTTKVAWPGQGTLITPLTGAGVPKLDLSGWLPTATIEVQNIAHGAADGTGDLTCP
jgi:hypothetical protein